MKWKRTLAVCLAAALAAELAWQQFFHCKVLVPGQTAYEPGFFYCSASGKREFRRIQGGKLTEGESEYQSGLRGGYPEAAEERLKKGASEDWGQLLVYHAYPVGELYACSGGEKPAWLIFLQTEQGIRKFQVEKSDRLETMTDCTSDGQFVYLHLLTSRKEMVLLRLDLETGRQTRDTVTLEQLGLREPAEFRFDPRTGKLICWFYSEGEWELLFYSFASGEKQIMHLNQPAEQLLAWQDGYVTVLPKYGGRVFFYFYDKEWRLIPEKEMWVDLVENGAMLTPISRVQQDEEVTVAEGIIYGCIEGEEALWYYGIDLEARKPAVLWEVQKPRGKLELRDHILFHKETGCEPYPTLF